MADPAIGALELQSHGFATGNVSRRRTTPNQIKARGGVMQPCLVEINGCRPVITWAIHTECQAAMISSGPTGSTHER
jgi:hypothetical protein